MHVLAVGSSVIDLFLGMDPDHVKIEGENVAFELGDKVPSEIKRSAAGGNGANVSVGLSRLEIPTTFYTYLGNDFFSREIYEKLSSEGVELDIERQDDKSIPLHIILDFVKDRVILANYSKTEHDFEPNDKNFDYLFLTSIPETWEAAYRKILDFPKSNNIPLVFSPGTRQIEDKNELTLEVVRNSKIYFSNKSEAERILEEENMEIKDVLSGIKNMGPEIVSITDATNGGYAVDKNGTMYHIGTLGEEGREKTGAGDAYATGFFAAICLGKEVKEAMLWGTLNASAVMREIGAQAGLLTKNALDTMLSANHNLNAETL